MKEHPTILSRRHAGVPGESNAEGTEQSSRSTFDSVRARGAPIMEESGHEW
jgi:hypothetical protein